MHALNRNLIALALGAVLVSPAAFAQQDKQDKDKAGQAATSAGQATADSARLMRLSASASSLTQTSRVTTAECAAAFCSPWLTLAV